MNWRDPKKELPKEGQIVWVMVYPHKTRGTLLESAMGIMIACGEVNLNGGSCRVENVDELGWGNIGWLLFGESDFDPEAIAWMPVEEMILPEVKLP